LEQLSKYVDFEIFRPVLTEAFHETRGQATFPFISIQKRS